VKLGKMDFFDSGHENNIISTHNKYPEVVGKSIKVYKKEDFL